jgi:hypothetical protein
LGRTGLSRKELSRVEVMGRVKAGSLRLGEAAELLELSYRQAKRIWARYRGGGAKALQQGNCGRQSNRAYTAKFRAAVLRQVQVRYEDFGPTLAARRSAGSDRRAAPRDRTCSSASAGTTPASTLSSCLRTRARSRP